MLTGLLLVLYSPPAYAGLTGAQVDVLRQWLFRDGIACGFAKTQAEAEWAVTCPTVPLNLPAALCVAQLQAGCEANCTPEPEIAYDGIDQDCDGVDLTDIDHDGYDGAEVGGADCDDLHAAVNPAAPEVCNGVDDDCDGLRDGTDPDVVGAPTWYRDSDGDGFGDPDVARERCTEPVGWVADGGDCDDGDAAVNPDAFDVCEDGVDADCDGADAVCGVYDATDADLVVLGVNAHDSVGSGLAAGGDWTGDGRIDVAIGAFAADDGASNSGTVYILDYAATGTHTTAELSRRLIGEATGDAPGTSLANGGDLDGDGYDDLLVGAPGEDSGGSAAGAVYVVSGPIVGSRSLSTAYAKITGIALHDDIQDGRPAGDVDGDGLGDLAVLSADNDVAGPGSGGVFLFFGGVTGTTDISAADAVLAGEGAYQAAGSAFAVGDVDGDGVDDLIVGASDWDADGSYTDNTGAVYVVLGPVTGDRSLSAADLRFTGAREGSEAGTSVGLDDLDEDGHLDLVATARLLHGDGLGGAAYVLDGPILDAVGFASPDAVLRGEDTYAHLGSGVVCPGDFDGDGNRDLFVADEQYGVTDNGQGAVFLEYGPFSGVRVAGAGERSESWLGSEVGQSVGESLATLGDLDGDGLPDLLFGSPDGNADLGGAYVVYGR